MWYDKKLPPLCHIKSIQCQHKRIFSSSPCWDSLTRWLLKWCLSPLILLVLCSQLFCLLVGNSIIVITSSFYLGTTLNSKHKFLVLPVRTLNAKIYILNFKNTISRALIMQFPVMRENKSLGSISTRNDHKLEIPSRVIIQSICTNLHVWSRS